MPLYPQPLLVCRPRKNPDFIRIFSSAPRPGLEPGTISLHMIHNFRYGVDYLISLQGIRVYSLYTFITCVNLARDYQLKGFPELARFFNSYYYEKLPYSTGSRSTIELPRNIVNTDRRILSQQTIVFNPPAGRQGLLFFEIYFRIFDKYGGIYTADYFSFFISRAFL